MFGFNLSVWMTRDIIRILNEQEDFITSKQLLEFLGYSNLAQIKKSLTRLNFIIKESQVDEEIQLVMDPHVGIRLNCSADANTHELISLLASQDLAYTIYTTMLFERKASTKEFCKKKFMSASTLQRRIKRINEFINPLGLHISFSMSEFKLIGNEATIRSFSFIYLYVFYRQFSAIPWIDNKTYYLDQAQKISDYLQLDFRTTQVDSMAFFIFITENAIQQGCPFSFKQVDFPCQERLGYPMKPPFIHWKDDEWQFLLLMAFNSNLVNFNIPIDTSDLHLEVLDGVFTDWLVAFEKYFGSLNEEQRTFLHKNIVRQYLATRFFIVNQEVLRAFPVVDFNLIQQAHPYYMQQFNRFWKAFSSSRTTWTDIHFKSQSFLLCEYFLSLQEALPEVVIFVFTDLTLLSSTQIQDDLFLYFSNKYRIVYTQNYQEASIIIGTIGTNGSLLSENQEFVMVHFQLTPHDLTHVDEAIQRVLLE